MTELRSIPQSGIPRPKSTYTLRRRPSGVLTPSKRIVGAANASLLVPPVPPLADPKIHTGRTSTIPQTRSKETGMLKPKTALSAPAVRPSPSRPLVPTDNPACPPLVPTKAPPVPTACKSSTLPHTVRKAPSMRSLTATAAANGDARGRASTSERPTADGNTVRVPTAVVPGRRDNIIAVDTERQSGPRLSGSRLNRKASRPGLRKIASRPSLNKAERAIVPPTHSRPSCRTKQRHVQDPPAQDIPAVLAMQTTRVRQSRGDIENTTSETSRLDAPKTRTEETPLLPRIKRYTRPWDSSESYSPLNNVQLSFDDELDSDLDDDRDSGRMADMQRRIAELQEQTNRQQARLAVMIAEREEATAVRDTARQIARTALTTAMMAEGKAVQNRYDAANACGMALRTDILAQLELIRTLSE